MTTARGVDVRSTEGARAGLAGVFLKVGLPVLIGVIAVVLAARSGGSLTAPVGHRFYELGMVIAAIAVLGYGFWQSIREGKQSKLLLMSIAAGTAFWQETYGDWGAYCLYSSQFATYTWQHTRWAAPFACWWFIAGYVVFYTSLFLALIAAVKFVRRRWPNINSYIAGALVSLPVFYVFDLAWEATTVGLGYWSYQYAFGPAMHVGGGMFPLLWPIVEQVPFMALAAFGLTWVNSRGEDVFEVAARTVTRRKPTQFGVLVSWIVLVNIAFFTTTILPLMLVRGLLGPSIPSIP